MTNETNLPPEVAEAWDNIDDCMRMDIKVNPVGPLKVIRGYLLQVTAELEYARDRRDQAVAALADAEAERDSLRARIDGAPVVKARGIVGNPCTVVVSHDLAGKQVRLVLESDSEPLESGSGGIVRVEDGE